MKNFASRPDSSVHQFKRRVPRSVLERVRGVEIVVELPTVGGDPATPFQAKLGEFAKGSLHTRNAETADARRLVVLAHLAKVYAAAKAGPVTLTQKQIQGLAGQVYRLLDDEHGEDPGTEAEWIAFKAITRAAVEGRIPNAQAIPVRGRSDDAIMAVLLFGENPETLTETVDGLAASWGTRALEQRVGRLAVWVLQRNGIEVDPASRLTLLREIARAALQFGHHAKKLARGDFRPDPDADRFPEFQKTKAKAITVMGVFERWKAEVKPTPSTISTWRGVLRSLEGHLKQDIEVARLTQADVLGWKDSLVERGIRPKTVNEQHLAGLKAMLNFAVRNGLASHNVAQGVRLQVKAKAGERMLPYSDEDVAALLAHAARETSPAKRWLPWLAVLTGARIGEVAQLWGSQVREVDGVPVIEIQPSPDGGTLKNAASERTVPIHPALVEAGFITFVQERGNAPLFYRKPARRGAESKHPSKGVSNYLATWIRSLPGFDDPRKAPSHASRHWFKTTGARLEIMDSLVNAIQGHVDGSTAGVYRHFTVEQMARAVARYPVPTMAEGKQAIPFSVPEPAEPMNEQHR